MAHCQKYSKAAVGHLFEHYDRTYQQEHIDKEKSHLNYNLAPDHDGLSQIEFLQKRCNEVKCMKRDDVKVMCDWVITMPKELPIDRAEEFFTATYDFLEKKYGKDNVISAYVHMDEKQPHMHFSWVPVVQDKKKGHLKVSAKECVTRGELRKFHPNLEKYLESVMGCPVHIMNGATKDGNQTIEQLKKLSEISDKVLDKQREFDDLKSSVDVIKSMSKIVDKIEVPIREEEDIPILKSTPEKTGLFKSPATVTIKEDDYNHLMSMVSTQDELLKIIEYAKQLMKELQNEKSKLSREIKKLDENALDRADHVAKNKIFDLEWMVSNLKSDVKNKDTLLDYKREDIEQRDDEISKLSAEIQTYKDIIAFFPEQWKTMESRTSRARKMEEMYYAAVNGEWHPDVSKNEWTNQTLYRWDGKDLTASKFLKAYRNECKSNHIPYDSSMVEHLETLERHMGHDGHERY